jgi:hypothetical protein
VGSPPIRKDDKEELRETRSMKYTVVTGFEFPDSTDEESNTGAEINSALVQPRSCRGCASRHWGKNFKLRCEVLTDEPMT